MSNISMRRRGELIQEVFRILIEHAEGLKAGDVLEQLQKRVTLSEYERGDYDSGPRFSKIVRFATLGPSKAGWLAKGKGWWSVTEEGRQALLRYPDPEEFCRASSKLYYAWKKNRPEIEVEERTDLSDSDDSLDESLVDFDSIEERAWLEIESYLKKMPWLEFQKMVADLLRAMGYHVVWEANTGQKGTDIIAFPDPIGTKSPRIRVEVKREQKPIDLDHVKAFAATINQHDVGIYASVSGFTTAARDYALENETKRITLLDAEKIVELWIEYSASLSEAARRRLELKPVYFLAQSE